jgi:hypothetical protein
MCGLVYAHPEPCSNDQPMINRKKNKKRCRTSDLGESKWEKGLYTVLMKQKGSRFIIAAKSVECCVFFGLRNLRYLLKSLVINFRSA